MDPAITLKESIEPALNKFSAASFKLGGHGGDPSEFITLSLAEDEARQELLLSIKKYVADALAQAGGYDPASGKRMKTLEEVKRAHVQYALALHDTMDKAARALGIDIATLFRMRKRWGMRIHEQHSAAWTERKLRESKPTSSDSE